MRSIGVLIVVLVAAAPSAGQSAKSTVTVDIQCSDERQRIDGFGASLFGGFQVFERGNCDQAVPSGVSYKTTKKQRREMINVAVKELGVSHVRIWLAPAGVEPHNDNDNPGVIDWAAFNWSGRSRDPQSENMLENRQNGLQEWGELLEIAIPLGLKNWIVTPGGLPNWLDRRIRDQNDDLRFEEYAEWAAAQLLYLKKTFGVEAPYWSMFNEPDVRGWTDTAMWVKWIRATGRRFRKEGLQTRIMFPDFMNVHRAVPIAAAVLEDEEARRYIGALAYHHYRSSGDGPQPFLQLFRHRETADRGPLFERLTHRSREMAVLGQRYDLPSWQTETAYYPRFTADVSEWEVGRARANEIHYELLSGASAVQGMLVIWVDAVDPRYDTSVRKEGHHIVMTTDGERVKQWVVTKNAGAVFAHYGRFVRPGDHRIAATSSDPLVRVTAFVSKRQDRYVAVMVNNSPHERLLTLRLHKPSMTITSFRALITDAEHGLAAFTPEWPTVGAPYRAELPGLSLVTFVWQQGDLDRFTLPHTVEIR